MYDISPFFNTFVPRKFTQKEIFQIAYLQDCNSHYSIAMSNTLFQGQVESAFIGECLNSNNGVIQTGASRKDI